MILIPLVSIAYYFITNGSQPYEGFALFKAYILISFACILYITRINLFPALCKALTVLAILIILVYIIVSIYPVSYFPIAYLGKDYGILLMGDREYSADLTLPSIFFVTSPMLAISIAYYVGRVLDSTKGKKLLYIIILLINCLGMFFAGTRNNMAVAIFLPITIIFLNSKRKALIGSFFIGCIVFFSVGYINEIQILLSPQEVSNEAKLGFVKDYFEIFKNPVDLIFGQGLGAYHFWSASRGYFYITELTYLEIIRNFGLIMGMIMMMLLLFPVMYAYFVRKSFTEKHIIVGYFFYLIMCISNPLFFSSLGMLILSIIIANIFLHDIYIYEKVTDDTDSV